MVVVLRSISMLVVVTRVGDKMENGSRLIKEVTAEERASLYGSLVACHMCSRYLIYFFHDASSLLLSSSSSLNRYLPFVSFLELQSSFLSSGERGTSPSLPPPPPPRPPRIILLLLARSQVKQGGNTCSSPLMDCRFSRARTVSCS